MKSVLMSIWSYRSEIGLWFGVVLVGVLGYEAGFVQGVRRSSSPIVIEKPVPTVVTAAADAPVPTSDTAPVTQSTGAKDQSVCPYVGSRNSNKYHLATCATAKRIKPENRVCFTSPEDAQSKKYQAGCVK